MNNSPLNALPAASADSINIMLDLALNGEMSMSSMIGAADDIALRALRNDKITRPQVNAITEYVRSF